MLKIMQRISESARSPRLRRWYDSIERRAWSSTSIVMGEVCERMQGGGSGLTVPSSLLSHGNTEHYTPELMGDGEALPCPRDIFLQDNDTVTPYSVNKASNLVIPLMNPILIPFSSSIQFRFSF